MTEEQWLAGTDPWPMLAAVQAAVTGRKRRLFAAAAFGRLLRLLPDARQQRGVEMLEQMAEGTVSRPAVGRAVAEVRQAIPRNEWVADAPPADDPHYIALMLYREFCSTSIARHAVHATAGLADGAVEQGQQVRLMRDIFGNPFRPVAFDPGWRTGTAVQLAQQMYDARDFGLMPLLADALEDAGCTDPGILSHCRGDGPHVRGCWVVDLVLGKE